VLVRARTEIIEQERNSKWVQELVSQPGGHK
jgi:hypothetical protein